MYKAPGKAKRNGITVMELADMFPDDETAMRWFESRIWPVGRCCPRCGGTRTREASHKTMPYWCTDCRKYFSVKTGTVMEASNFGYRKWVFAIYLHLTSLKGVSSMKLHRDIGGAQKNTWYLLQRIRKAFDGGDDDLFGGPIEVDETYVGGLEANKHESKKLRAGRGTVGKAVVVGAKDRETGKIKADVVPDTTAQSLQTFVLDSTELGAKVYTDENTSYKGLRYLYDHEAVNHGVGEYVKEQAHINGVESFWATLKRAHKGVYHKFSKKHLHRYVKDFAGRHGLREYDTLDQMGLLAQGMIGKRLQFREITA